MSASSTEIRSVGGIYGKMRMGRTKGGGQKADLAFACERLADETQKGHCEADGHVLIEHLGLINSKMWSITLLLPNLMRTC